MKIPARNSVMKTKDNAFQQNQPVVILLERTEFKTKESNRHTRNNGLNHQRNEALFNQNTPHQP